LFPGFHNTFIGAGAKTTQHKVCAKRKKRGKKAVLVGAISESCAQGCLGQNTTNHLKPELSILTAWSHPQGVIY